MHRKHHSIRKYIWSITKLRIHHFIIFCCYFFSNDNIALLQHLVFFLCSKRQVSEWIPDFLFPCILFTIIFKMKVPAIAIVSFSQLAFVGSLFLPLLKINCYIVRSHTLAFFVTVICYISTCQRLQWIVVNIFRCPNYLDIFFMELH